MKKFVNLALFVVFKNMSKQYSCIRSINNCLVNAIPVKLFYDVPRRSVAGAQQHKNNFLSCRIVNNAIPISCDLWIYYASWRITHLSDVSQLINDFRHFVVLGVDGRRPVELRVVHLCAQQRPDDIVRVSVYKCVEKKKTLQITNL